MARNSSLRRSASRSSMRWPRQLPHQLALAAAAGPVAQPRLDGRPELTGIDGLGEQHRVGPPVDQVGELRDSRLPRPAGRRQIARLGQASSVPSRSSSGPRPPLVSARTRSSRPSVSSPPELGHDRRGPGIDTRRLEQAPDQLPVAWPAQVEQDQRACTVLTHRSAPPQARGRPCRRPPAIRLAPEDAPELGQRAADVQAVRCHAVLEEPVVVRAERGGSRRWPCAAHLPPRRP